MHPAQDVDGETNASLWSRDGVAQAISAGDLCIALGYAAMESVPVSDDRRWQITKSVTHAAQQIVGGQAAELKLLDGPSPTFEQYAACVEGRTSARFALPIEGAAPIAGRSSAETATLVESCYPLGLLFQMQDEHTRPKAA